MRKLNKKKNYLTSAQNYRSIIEKTFKHPLKTEIFKHISMKKTSGLLRKQLPNLKKTSSLFMNKTEKNLPELKKPYMELCKNLRENKFKGGR